MTCCRYCSQSSSGGTGVVFFLLVAIASLFSSFLLFTDAGLLYNMGQLVGQQLSAFGRIGLVLPFIEINIKTIRKGTRLQLLIHSNSLAIGMHRYFAQVGAKLRFHKGLHFVGKRLTLAFALAYAFFQRNFMGSMRRRARLFGLHSFFFFLADFGFILFVLLADLGLILFFLIAAAHFLYGFFFFLPFFLYSGIFRFFFLFTYFLLLVVFAARQLLTGGSFVLSLPFLRAGCGLLLAVFTGKRSLWSCCAFTGKFICSGLRRGSAFACRLLFIHTLLLHIRLFLFLGLLLHLIGYVVGFLFVLIIFFSYGKLGLKKDVVLFAGVVLRFGEERPLLLRRLLLQRAACIGGFHRNKYLCT
eukprot:Unigene19111_Nuclearia_a/m.54268 Unigene19111_Nuclearia_a/g.54268  ORF Unigene19111_Nuclearia_a/g.54268 Unigene19111_Nuclearia_a/m.54268 type:complete len:358 (-) Unigene19111_Nuclearia_a:843-1916(-)